MLVNCYSLFFSVPAVYANTYIAGTIRRWFNDFAFPYRTRRSMAMDKTRYVNMYTTRAYKTVKIINIGVLGVDRRGLRRQISFIYQQNHRVCRAHKFPSCCTCIIANVMLRGQDPQYRDRRARVSGTGHITRVYCHIIIY